MRDVTPVTLPEFWGFIRERHAITHRKADGVPPPWTKDPILQAFKFTNIYRELDRHTVELRFRFRGDRDRFWADPMVFCFNVVLFRWFNWIPTWDVLGYVTRWDPAAVKRKLHARSASGRTVFTNAYIIRSDEGMTKIDSIVDALTAVWKRKTEVVKQTKEQSIEHFTTWMAAEFHLIGDFMAYEIATDLRHTPALERATDIMTWANPGPGARRGLRRLAATMPHLDPVPAMRHLLGQQHAGKYGTRDLPRMEMRDVEHSLCEADKYFRVLFGEGEPRCLYKPMTPPLREAVLAQQTKAQADGRSTAVVAQVAAWHSRKRARQQAAKQGKVKR